MRLAPDLTHEQKEAVIKEYASKYDLKIMVETGIFEGKMILGTHDHFDQIHSVELDKRYYDNAVANFKQLNNVSLYNGNSPDILRSFSVLKSDKCLIWLDAHDGQQSPVMEELRVIFDLSDKEHIILIDDMRNFDDRPKYPNISLIKDFVMKERPHWNIEMADDIMRVGKGCR